MQNTIKNSLRLLMTWFVFTCLPASAATYFGEGPIKILSVTDAALPYEGPVITVVSFAAAGSCPVDGSGMVPLIMRDDSKGKVQLSIALSAFMAQTTVKIQVEDSQKDPNGVCYLRWIGLES